MKILGCDLHAKQQSIAMVDTETGEFTEKTVSHEGNEVREFYAALEGRVVVGIEATGAMQCDYTNYSLESPQMASIGVVSVCPSSPGHIISRRWLLCCSR